MEIPRERGFQKPKFLKEIMKLKQNFQGEGFKLENLLWEGYMKIILWNKAIGTS